MDSPEMASEPAKAEPEVPLKPAGVKAQGHPITRQLLTPICNGRILLTTRLLHPLTLMSETGTLTVAAHVTAWCFLTVAQATPLSQGAG